MKKDILKVFIPNLIKLLATVITAFLIPQFLSVDEYGYIKLYKLLASYIGLSALGYCDGTFIKHGGKSINEISTKELSTEQKTIFVWQMFFTIVITFIGIISRDFIVLMFGLSFVPTIFITYFLTLSQSVGAFNDYSKIYNAHSILTIVSNLMCLYIFKCSSAKAYIFATVLVNYMSSMVVIILFNQKYKIKGGKPSFDCFIDNVKTGILITAGNMAYTVFSSIDKWFVKILEGITHFSYYSFAVELLTAVNMFANPIAYTLFSYISKKKSPEFELYIKRGIIVWLFFILNGVYVLKMIIKSYIPKYESAISIMVILFLSQIFYSLNYSIYVNLFKVYKKQRDYFVKLLIIIFISFVSNAFAYYFVKQELVSFAYATLFCMIVWSLINLKSFPHLKFGIKDNIYIIGMCAAYLLTNQINNDIVALALYFVFFIIWMQICMKDIFGSLLSDVGKLLKFI